MSAAPRSQSGIPAFIQASQDPQRGPRPLLGDANASQGGGRSSFHHGSMASHRGRRDHDDEHSYISTLSHRRPSYDEQSFRGSVRGSRTVASTMRSVASRRSTQTAASRVARGNASVRQEGAPPQDPGERIMSVVLEGPNIAFCCYNEDRNDILIEHCKSSGFETEALVDRFVQVARPTLLLVGTKIVSNAPLLDLLTKAPSALPDDENEEEEGRQRQEYSGQDTPSSSIRYLVLKSGRYDLQNCKNTILQKLRVTSIMRDNEQRGHGAERTFHADPRRHFQGPAATAAPTSFAVSRFHCLSTVIDFDSSVLVKALGALVSHLETTIFQLDGGIIRVNRIVEARTSE